MFEQKLGYKLLPAGTTDTMDTYRATSITLQAKGGTLLVAGVTIVVPTTLTHITVTKTHYTFDGQQVDQVFSTLDSIQFSGLLHLHNFGYATAQVSLATLEQVDAYFARKLNRDTWEQSTDRKRQKALYMATAHISRHTLSEVPQLTMTEAVARLAVKYLEGWTQSPGVATVSFHGISEKQGTSRLAPDSWADPRAYQLLLPYITLQDVSLDRV